MLSFWFALGLRVDLRFGLCDLDLPFWIIVLGSWVSSFGCLIQI